MSSDAIDPFPGVPTAPPLARESSGSGARLWTVLALLAGILCISAWFIVASSVDAYQAGRRNEWYFPLPLLWLLGWLAGMILLIVTATAGRGAGRLMARGALVTCIAALPVGCYVRDLPHERHQTGFVHWVALDVNDAAIHQWSTTLPPVATDTPVPPAQWPAAVVALAPANVEQVPGGVVLQWGRLSTWGTSRKVFIADDDTKAPPPDLHHFWRQVREGVYAAVQPTY